MTMYYVAYYNGDILYPPGSISKTAHILGCGSHGSYQKYYIIGFDEYNHAERFFLTFTWYSVAFFKFDIETKKYIMLDNKNNNNDLISAAETFLNGKK